MLLYCVLKCISSTIFATTLAWIPSLISGVFEFQGVIIYLILIPKPHDFLKKTMIIMMIINKIEKNHGKKKSKENILKQMKLQITCHEI